MDDARHAAGLLDPETTLPRLLLERARQTPRRVALRAKRRGIYQEVTWAGYLQHVTHFALGLRACGLEPGDRVAIMGDPCPEWVYADLATQSVGGVPFGIYPTNAPAEVAQLMQDSEATIFIAEHQEHLDKVLAVVDRLPRLRRIIVIDTRALFMHDYPLVTTFAEAERLGAEIAAREPDLLPQLAANVTPDDLATLVYTSGTTGVPKGVMHSQRTLIAGAHSFVLAYPAIARHAHRTVAHLPLAHVVERTMTSVLPLIAPVVPHFGEDVENVAETLWEVAPTLCLSVPRYWEKLASQLVIGVRASSWIKRVAYRGAMAVGRRTVESRWQRQREPLWLRGAYLAARWLVFRPLLDKLGLTRLQVALTGAAAIPPGVKTLWQIWGVDLREVYGQTEAAAVITASQRPFAPAGQVGTSVPHPAWQVKLGPDGEVLYRSPSVFIGYWRSPEATAAILEDGWLRTGDMGAWDETGELRLVDRKKDLMVTSGGKTMSPLQIENALKGSSYITEAVVFGEARKYVTALIELDLDAVLEWARLHGIPYTSYTALTQHPEIQRLIAAEVAAANAQLARVEQVKQFRIIPKELDPEAGETTPTRKVKRGQMYEMFRDLIESMYEPGAEDLIATEVGPAHAER